ncbi:MAG: protein translocase subunit SecD [Verrucomicrobiales bacterium]|jgi:SecD/SecF fusion protein|nr:protein translocase subunit SecD [Verrucomicrobiales bacterium]
MTQAFVLLLSLAFLIFFVWYLVAHTDRGRRWLALLLIGTAAAVCAVSLFTFKDGAWQVNIKEGLDLKGGSQFTIQLAGENIKAENLDQAVEVIRKRIDAQGVAEPIIQPLGSNRILVQIPGASESQKEVYRAQLQRVAKLEFRMVEPDSERILAAKEPIPFDSEALPYVKEKNAGGQGQDAPQGYIIVKKRAAMGGSYVKSAFGTMDNLGRPEVAINFNAEGKEKFGRLTSDNVNQRMAIVLDGEVYSAPVIRTPILDGNCVISGGNMKREEAQELASVLENPLEQEVAIVDERGVDPTLGAASIASGFQAALIGLVLVAGFMLVYYRKAGLIAIVSLAVNMFVLMGLLAQFGFTLTMPGVAGIILTIGIGVDANVLIFERIREELAHHTDLYHAIRAGFSKAFSSILDANVTTIIASVMLFWQGTGAIQGFAITLTLGILSSLFAALVVSRACFDWLQAYSPLQSLTMMQWVKDTKLPFMGVKWATAALSLLLVAGSLFVFHDRGDKAYGVDFEGGDLLTLSFAQKVSDEDVRGALGGMEALPQYQKDANGASEVLAIRTPFEKGEAAERALQEKFPRAEFKRLQLDKVSAVIGGEFRVKAGIALGLGLLGIFIYVMLRFEAAYAIGAIVAIIHDIIITLGVYVLLGHELSLVTIGALLTIAGYSINDTIIVFDRIREHLRHDTRTPLATLFNHAINATLSRTMLTSGTTLLAVLALFFFGGMVIHDFALMLLLGIFVGTYSSIFIASPVVLLFGRVRRGGVSVEAAGN